MNARDDFFDKSFKKAFGRIEDHKFRGYNSALGCFVEGKDHYRILMKNRGLVPYEAAEQLAEEFDNKNERRRRERSELSPKAQDIIRSLRICADRNGNITLGNRAINALMEIGALGNSSEYEPQFCQQGGFN